MLLLWATLCFNSHSMKQEREIKDKPSLISLSLVVGLKPEVSIHSVGMFQSARAASSNHKYNKWTKSEPVVVPVYKIPFIQLKSGKDGLFCLKINDDDDK